MKLLIGYATFTVRAMPPGRDGDDEANGMCRPNEAVIEINPNLPPARQAEVFIHEVLHGVWHAMAMAKKLDEEAAVTALARGLAQVMRDNPEFAAAISAAHRRDQPIVKPDRR